MKRLKVLMGDRIVGQLLAQEGAHYFSFDESFIKAPLPLSSSKLPVAPRVREHREGYFLTLTGLIYDSLPDPFGMSAAAVIRRVQALSGIIGGKGCVGGCLSLG